VEERTLTIKIRYYPVPKKSLASSILIIFFFFLGYLFQPVMEQWTTELRASTMIAHLPKFYSSPFLKEVFAQEKDLGENSPPPQKEAYDHVVFNGPRDQKKVALTFDADMTGFMRSLVISGEVKSYYDKPLVDYLIETKTKATLFLAGMWIELYPDEAKELGVNPLFELGNHSYSHRSFAGDCYGLGEFPDNEDNEEIEKTENLLTSVAGVTNKVFRFPGGCYGQQDVSVMHEKGLVPIQWDVEGRDGFNDNASAIITNVLSRTTNGSIIVLHMNGYPNEPKTLEALKEIIPTLKKKGYEFVKVSELLGLDEKPREVVSLPSFWPSPESLYN
jgi:peptidoglycan-N-acetylglucosamine deacetylase